MNFDYLCFMQHLIRLFSKLKKVMKTNIEVAKWFEVDNTSFLMPLTLNIMDIPVLESNQRIQMNT